MQRVFLAFVAMLAMASDRVPAFALDGNDLALKSIGSASGNDWVLNENGYVGTYVTLAAAGNVTIDVAASGLNGGGADSRMSIVVGDQRANFNVPLGFNAYQHTFSLPAGTHFVRTEYSNDFVNNVIPAAARSLTVRSVEVAGATLNNANTNDNALAAADTYIANGRRGPARVSLLGAAPGAQATVKLRQHAFDWGSNVYGTQATAPPPLTNPQFVQFFKDHFNMVVPSRGGKWNNNEAVRDVQTLDYMDSILRFAEDHGMGARMHNLIWGDDASSEEQPAWAVAMLQAGGAGDLAQLRSEISERIDYYVGDGPGGFQDQSLRYTQLDVYNESWHTGFNTPGNSANYWDRFGPAGVAGIYEEAAQAAKESGANLRLYVNEYNILQNGPDAYGNWYRQHIETIQNADGNPSNGPISGIGMQLYPLSGLSAAYMQQVLQTMSVSKLPLSLTEFGVQESVTDPQEILRYVEDSMRMIFGSPSATTFMYWGVWASATSNLQRASVLANADWSLTDAGKLYEDLLGINDGDGDPTNGWTTNLTIPVAADGTIDFTGFFGDYDVTIGGQTFSLRLKKGTTAYALAVGSPSADFDGDGDVDGADALAWQRGLGIGAAALRSQGDADLDGDVDDADLAWWRSEFGLPATGAKAATVPEPAGGLAFLAAWLACARRTARNPAARDRYAASQ